MEIASAVFPQEAVVPDDLDLEYDLSGSIETKKPGAHHHHMAIDWSVKFCDCYTSHFRDLRDTKFSC